MEELDVEEHDDLGEVSLEEPVILSPTKPSNLDDSDSWSDVKSPVRSPPDSRDRGDRKMKGQYLDDYMEEQDIGGRNDVKSSARQLDSRASSTRNLDSRGSTGYDTFTDSVVDEKHERRLERKREQGGRRSDAGRGSSRRYGDDDSDESPPSKQSYRSRHDRSSRSGSLQTLHEEPAPAVVDPSAKYRSLRPEDPSVADMRRKNLDLEKEVEELKDIVEDWRSQKKKSEVLEQATTEELERVKKVLRSVTKERDELSHSSALLTLKLNKNVANGVIDDEGEAAPVTKFEKDNIEAAAGAKARREADEVWEAKVSKVKEAHAEELAKLQNKIATLNLTVATEKEFRVSEGSKTLMSLELQQDQVKDVTQLVGELKQRLYVAEQERDSVQKRETELIAKAKVAIEAKSKAELDVMAMEEDVRDSTVKADIASEGLKTASSQITALEETIVKMRSDYLSGEKERAADAVLLKRLQLKQAYEDDEVIMLKGALDKGKRSIVELERVKAQEVAELKAEIEAVKRQLVIVESDGNDRFQRAESERVAAEWEKKRAVEHAETLAKAKAREIERALRQETIAREMEDKVVDLRREVMAAKEKGEAQLVEYKGRLERSKGEVATLKEEREKIELEMGEKVALANVAVEEVRNEVTRKVPQLAASALKRAEDEWKKRIYFETQKCRDERDRYIQSAKGSVETLERNLGDFKKERVEMESVVRRLERENGELRDVNTRLEGDLNATANSANTTMPSRHQQSGMWDIQTPQPPPPPQQLYNSLQEVAANATLTTLQAQLSIMQSQCRNLLNSADAPPPSTVPLGVNDLNVTNVTTVTMDEDVEKLFSSPVKKSGSRGKDRVTFDDELFIKSHDMSLDASNVSIGGVGEDSMNRSGYLGNLWKSRYGRGGGPR